MESSTPTAPLTVVQAKEQSSFENAGNGLLKYGNSVYTFRVYQRLGTQAQALNPLSEQDWSEVAKKLIPVANDILQKNKGQNPDQALNVLMKFHNLDAEGEGIFSLQRNHDRPLNKDDNLFKNLQQKLIGIYSKQMTFNPSHTISTPSISPPQPQENPISTNQQESDSNSEVPTDHGKDSSLSSTPLLPQTSTTTTTTSTTSNQSPLTPRLNTIPISPSNPTSYSTSSPQIEATLTKITPTKGQTISQKDYESHLRAYEALCSRSRFIASGSNAANIKNIDHSFRDLINDYYKVNYPQSQISFGTIYYSPDGKKSNAQPYWIAIYLNEQNQYEIFLPFHVEGNPKEFLKKICLNENLRKPKRIP